MLSLVVKDVELSQLAEREMLASTTVVDCAVLLHLTPPLVLLVSLASLALGSTRLEPCSGSRVVDHGKDICSDLGFLCGGER